MACRDVCEGSTGWEQMDGRVNPSMQWDSGLDPESGRSIDMRLPKLSASSRKRKGEEREKDIVAELTS